MFSKFAKPVMQDKKPLEVFKLPTLNFADFQNSKFGEAPMFQKPFLPPSNEAATSKPEKAVTKKTKNDDYFRNLMNLNELEILSQSGDCTDGHSFFDPKVAKAWNELQSITRTIRKPGFKGKYEVAELKEQVEHLEEEKNELNSNNAILLDENIQLKNDLMQQKNETNEIVKQLEEAGNELKSTKAQMDLLNESLTEFELFKKRCADERSEAQQMFNEQMEFLKSQSDDTQRQLVSLLKPKEIEFQKLNRAYSELKDKNYQLNQHMLVMKTKYEIKVKDLETSNEKVSSSNSILKEKLTQSNTEINQLMGKIETFEWDCKQMKEQIDRLAPFESESEELKLQLENMRNKFEELESSNSVLLASIETYEKQSTELNTKIAENETAIEQNNSAIEQQEQKIAELTASLEKNQQQVAQLETEKAQLETEKAELNQLKETLQTQVAELNSNIAKLSADKENLETDALNVDDLKILKSPIKSILKSPVRSSPKSTAAAFELPTMNRPTPSSTRKRKLNSSDNSRKNVRFEAEGLPRYSKAEKDNKSKDKGIDMSFIKKSMEVAQKRLINDGVAEKSKATNKADADLVYDSQEELDCFLDIFA